MLSLTKNEDKDKVYRLGTWNVRSARNKEEKLIREMKRYNLNILGLSETKGKGNGMKVIDGASYVYAGVKEGRARGGVGIVVVERWVDCIRSWRCVNERCIMVRLKIEGEAITIVQVYAPTDNKDNDTKEEFYAWLQEVIARTQRGDRVVVMGDFNERVGNNVGRWSDVKGKHGEEVENDSGRRLLNFCGENDLRIMNTFLSIRIYTSSHGDAQEKICSP